METTVGTPPSAAEETGFAAAANLAPDKSLARIQELAKFVFANVAVVGTLLTGLGLFTDLGEVLENSPTLGGPFNDVPVALAALGSSLLCASFAIWPKMSSVDLARLDEVEDWYTWQIRRRGFWMIVSLALFSIGIAVATFSGTGAAKEPEKPSISGSWTGAGDKATVKIAVEAEEVPDGWLMVTTVWAKEAGGQTRIFSNRTRPDADGALKVAGEIGLGEAIKPESVESQVRLFDPGGGGEDEAESTMTLTRG